MATSLGRLGHQALSPLQGWSVLPSFTGAAGTESPSPFAEELSPRWGWDRLVWPTTPARWVAPASTIRRWLTASSRLRQSAVKPAHSQTGCPLPICLPAPRALLGFADLNPRPPTAAGAEAGTRLLVPGLLEGGLQRRFILRVGCGGRNIGRPGGYGLTSHEANRENGGLDDAKGSSHVLVNRQK
jgi:hypothetical protein